MDLAVVRKADAAPLNLGAARDADSRFETDRASIIALLRARQRLPDNTAEKYALDQLVELRGGYARLANYYDINLQQYGIGPSREDQLRAYRTELEQRAFNEQRGAFIALLESSGGQPLNSAGQPTGNEAFAFMPTVTSFPAF